MTSQKNWMQRHPILTVIGVIFGFTFLHGFFSGFNDASNSYNSPPPSRTTQTQQRNTVDTYSPAYKLAAVQAGTAPSSSLVSQFDSALSDLSRKCPSDSKSKIANYIYVGWQKIDEAGVRMTLLKTVQGINDSVPAEATGTVNCMEVAAAWVTLVVQ